MAKLLALVDEALRELAGTGVPDLAVPDEYEESDEAIPPTRRA